MTECALSRLRCMSEVTAEPRRSLREAQKELTRVTLLDAALKAFEESGYVNVTVDDIVRRAGAGRGTFYLYFDSKAAVFQAVLQKLGIREQYQALFARLAAIDTPSVDALQTWFEEYADLYGKNVAFHRALHQAQAVEPAFTDVVLNYLAEALAQWSLPGFASDGDVEKLRLTALASYVMTEGVMYLWLVHGVEMDRATTTRVLAGQFYAALLGSGPSATIDR
jgi:AcrR family transcriptional regulator